MNFLKGRSIGATAGLVFNAGEASIDLDGYVADGAGLRPGRAILGVRPEHILVGSGDGALQADVDIVEPMGSDSLVWLDPRRPADLGAGGIDRATTPAQSWA